MRNHQKPFADPEFSSYDVKKDYQINCPSHLRITPYGGAPKVYYLLDWEQREKFWRIIDFQESLTYYLPTTEACVRMSIFGLRDGDRARYLSNIAKREVIYKDRYLIEPINRKVFIRKTERTHRVCWDFAKRGGYEESD